MKNDNPKIHTCESCGKQFFEEEGLEYETLCEDCRDYWWRKDD